MSQRRRSTELPERIGRHELLVPIARGGMGVVYLARTHGPGGFEREVALKLLHGAEGDPHALDLIEEAKLASRIRHPNVVQVFDVDEGPRGVYMTMEYVEGASLSGLLRAARAGGGRLPPEIGLRILLDALAGLAAAHDLAGPDGRPLGLVHRDFSPQNILVGVDGAGKLTDFGIAKAASRDGRTRTGTIKGKIAYMAPEQIRGEPLDRRCDVWAAGMIAWEIMAGRHMYEVDDVAMMYRIVHNEVPRLRAVAVDVPVALDEAIGRALMRDRAARCPSADAFARTLEASGIEPAEPDEVAAYVRRLVGSELAARRAQVAERLSRAAPEDEPTLEEEGDAPPQSVPPLPPPAAASERPARRVALPLGIGAVAAALAAAFGAWRAPRPAIADAAPSSGVAAEAPAPRATAEVDAGRGPDTPAPAPCASAPPSAPPRPASPAAAAKSARPTSASVPRPRPPPSEPPPPLAPSPYGRSP